MIVLFAVCTRDEDLALENARWIQELGGCQNHEILFLNDKRCGLQTVQNIKDSLSESFPKVHRHVVKAEVDGWPEGANYFFRLAATILQDKPYKYFLWLEPDAIPLKSGWLDSIEAEYKACGKLFMGNRVEVNDVPLHMSGIGVYPNPIYQFAGEAYRAHETAWDVAAKDQIVPQAHFTKLIEHAWRHPSFTSAAELTTQIRSEAVLFHSSKDGSLIKLLREQRNHAADFGVAAQKSLGTFIDTLHPVPSHDTFQSAISRGPIDVDVYKKTITDIFIKTYPADYPWLIYCLKAIRKFATGFRRVVIVSPEMLPVEVEGVDWRVMNEESGDGYLAQQIAKLYADVTTNYGPDYILHIDSDVILTQPVTPDSFLKGSRSMAGGKIVWAYTPYSAIDVPWKPIVEKFMGCPVENEFMRRFPMMIPRWLYSGIRDFCNMTHNKALGDYICDQPYRSFSEFNALGAYAFKFHRAKFEWVNTLETELPPPFGKQYFSWGGLTDEITNEIETILAGGVTNPSPLSSSEPVDSPPSKISLSRVSEHVNSPKPAGVVQPVGKRHEAKPTQRENDDGRSVVAASLHRPSQANIIHQCIEYGEMMEHIEAILDYASQSHGNRIQVGRRLSSAGLTKTKRRKKKHAS